jgi:hypothetical protein
MWEPCHLRTLWASTARYRDSFTFFSHFNFNEANLNVKNHETEASVKQIRWRSITEHGLTWTSVKNLMSFSIGLRMQAMGAKKMAWIFKFYHCSLVRPFCKFRQLGFICKTVRIIYTEMLLKNLEEDSCSFFFVCVCLL